MALLSLKPSNRQCFSFSRKYNSISLPVHLVNHDSSVLLLLAPIMWIKTVPKEMLRRVPDNRYELGTRSTDRVLRMFILTLGFWFLSQTICLLISFTQTEKVNDNLQVSSLYTRIPSSIATQLPALPERIFNLSNFQSLVLLSNQIDSDLLSSSQRPGR